MSSHVWLGIELAALGLAICASVLSVHVWRLVTRRAPQRPPPRHGPR